MQFNLYIELGLRAENSRVLDLLRFPCESAFGSHGEWAARWWAHGKTRRTRSSKREKILEAIAAEGLNELVFTWRALEPVTFERLKMISGRIEFFPSPMNSLWAPVPLVKLKARPEETMRKNFRNAESVLKRDHKLPYPSSIEFLLQLDAHGEGFSDDEFQDKSVQWIRAAIPEGLATQDVFGYGCVHGTCRRMSMRMSLGFPEIDSLGKQFENVYPIMLGPRASCKGLASVLEGISSLVPISDTSPSAMLTVPPGKVAAAREVAGVKAWIVDRPPVPDLRGPRVFVVPPKPKA